VLARAAAFGDDKLEPALRALIAAEFLYEQELYPEAVYAFKHPLTQEVAYNSQLGERRATVHRRVAEALQDLYADKLDERAALLARHWEAAGDPLAAARWSARAAAWVGLNDIAEALRHWRKVSELVEALPDSAESSALALGARVARLHYGWRLGISEQEATAHYEAGRELAERSGDTVNLLLITAAYANVRGLSGHVEEYGELAEEVNRLGIEIGDPGLRIATMGATAYARWVRGRLAESLAIVDEGIALGAEDPTLGGGLILACPYAWHLMIRGALLTSMGYPEEAAPMLDRALEAAGEHGDHETETWTHGNYVALARTTGQQELALGNATQAYELAERIGDAFSRTFALYNRGYARIMAGEASEAVIALERSIELGREARTALEQESLRVAALSEALLSAGDCGRALEAAEESVQLARERGNEAMLAICYRVLAEALLASDGSGKVAAAQEALEKATAAAETTGSRSELPFIERAREKLVPVG
jgi:tetratricopeptide (TPR) repeat protein